MTLVREMSEANSLLHFHELLNSIILMQTNLELILHVYSDTFLSANRCSVLTIFEYDGCTVRSI